jgi:hypothetical protein
MIADHVRNQLLSSEITGKNAAARGLHHLKINA